MKLEDFKINAPVIVKAAPWHGQRFRVVDVWHRALPPVVILGLEGKLSQRYAFDPSFVYPADERPMAERLAEVITDAMNVAQADATATRIRRKIENDVIPSWEAAEYNEELAAAIRVLADRQQQLAESRARFLADFGG